MKPRDSAANATLGTHEIPYLASEQHLKLLHRETE